MNFTELGLSKPVLRALDEKGYDTPTPIQGEAIPHVLDGRDVLGCAQTGTGKTAAFAIPIIERLLPHGARQHIRVLIVTPTRELAIQIQENLEAYGRHTPLRSTVIFGGVGQNPQVRALKQGVDVLVATPGRLLDLKDQGFVHLDRLEVLVLDEADRMLDMGFIHDIRKILKAVPSQRQTLFFSATMPDAIAELSRTILTDPVRVEVTPASTTAETVRQQVYYTNKDLKKNLFLHILKDPDIDQALVFSRTKHGADRIVRHLKKKNIRAAAIHGNKSQNQRQKALQDFKDGKLRLLIATDIASRGIDIKELRHVINYDVPNEPESYVHRIGRSGRAGEAGHAISICEPEENAYIRDIERLIGQSIDVVEDHPHPQTDRPMTKAEKKEFLKEKARRRQEHAARRRAKRGRRR